MSQLDSALRRVGSCAAVLALICSTAVVLAPSVAATPATYFVESGGDNGNDCTSVATACATIQAAVDKAAADDSIQIGAGTFHESVEIGKSLEITGAGVGLTKIVGDGDGLAGVDINAASDDSGLAVNVTLQDLSISDNASGGITSLAHTLILDDVAVSNNAGGGIFQAGGTLDIEDSTLDANTGVGVLMLGTAADSTLYLRTSTISNTVPDPSGGLVLGTGVVAIGGDVSVQTSTLTGNTGQALLAVDANLDISDSTITATAAQSGSDSSDGPFADVPSAGIVQTDDSALIPAARGRQISSTPGASARIQRKVQSALAHADAVSADMTADITGTIVAEQAAGVADCSIGDITDDGYNLSSDAANSCGFSAADHDVIKVNPALGALADNGGPTKTLMPSTGSPAIDKMPPGEGTCNDDFGTDQRRVDRPIGSGCDIGAVEAPAAAKPPAVVPPTCPPLVIDTTTLPDGTVGTPYSVQLQASGGCDSNYTWTVPSEAPEGGFPSAGAQRTAPGGEQNPAARRDLGRTPPPPTPQPTTPHPTTSSSRPPVNTPTVHSSPASAPTSSTAAPTESSSSTEPAGNSAPPGLTLGADGVLSGTPTQAGTFTFTVSVNDPVLATLVLHVGAAATGTSSTPAPSTSHGVGGVSTTAGPPATATSSAGTGPLANTGASVGPQVRLAVLLLVAGGGLVFAGTRRRRYSRQH
ncbi:MAG TPA: choice-of-anchor Q domain-containing protein [Jatrophihabitantaceae bacterium]|nr:choice-of-anchor Q domain-containing protein [Jatrophihabitantaceae bacterium]